RRRAASRLLGAVAIRTGSHARSRSGISLTLALDVECPRRAWTPGLRRRAVRPMGSFLPDGCWPACNLSREFGDAQVGLTPIQHAGRLHEQLVGRAADLRGSERKG